MKSNTILYIVIGIVVIIFVYNQLPPLQSVAINNDLNACNTQRQQEMYQGFACIMGCVQVTNALQSCITGKGSVGFDPAYIGKFAHFTGAVGETCEQKLAHASDFEKNFYSCAYDVIPGCTPVRPPNTCGRDNCNAQYNNCPNNEICNINVCVCNPIRWQGTCGIDNCGETFDNCQGGQVCNNGHCVDATQCTTDAQCSVGQSCNRGSCVDICELLTIDGNYEDCRSKSGQMCGMNNYDDEKKLSCSNGYIYYASQTFNPYDTVYFCYLNGAATYPSVQVCEQGCNQQTGACNEGQRVCNENEYQCSGDTVQKCLNNNWSNQQSCSGACYMSESYALCGDCNSNSDCSSGQVCNNHNCQCQPETCASKGYSCGSFTTCNGVTVLCGNGGNCPTGQTCNANHQCIQTQTCTYDAIKPCNSCDEIISVTNQFYSGICTISQVASCTNELKSLGFTFPTGQASSCTAPSGSCTIPGDQTPCCTINLSELSVIIQKYADGQSTITLSQLSVIIQKYADGQSIC